MAAASPPPPAFRDGTHLATALDLSAKKEDNAPHELGPAAWLTTVYLKQCVARGEGVEGREREGAVDEKKPTRSLIFCFWLNPLPVGSGQGCPPTPRPR